MLPLFQWCMITFSLRICTLYFLTTFLAPMVPNLHCRVLNLSLEIGTMYSAHNIPGAGPDACHSKRHPFYRILWDTMLCPVTHIGLPDPHSLFSAPLKMTF